MNGHYLHTPCDKSTMYQCWAPRGGEPVHIRPGQCKLQMALGLLERPFQKPFGSEIPVPACILDTSVLLCFAHRSPNPTGRLSPTLLPDCVCPSALGDLRCASKVSCAGVYALILPHTITETVKRSAVQLLSSHCQCSEHSVLSIDAATPSQIRRKGGKPFATVAFGVNALSTFLASCT